MCVCTAIGSALTVRNSIRLLYQWNIGEKRAFIDNSIDYGMVYLFTVNNSKEKRDMAQMKECSERIWK